jgi:hypothetical protein
MHISDFWLGFLVAVGIHEVLHLIIRLTKGAR